MTSCLGTLYFSYLQQRGNFRVSRHNYGPNHDLDRGNAAIYDGYGRGHSSGEEGDTDPIQDTMQTAIPLIRNSRLEQIFADHKIMAICRALLGGWH